MKDHWNAPHLDGLALQSNDSSASSSPGLTPPFADMAPLMPVAVPADTVHTLNHKALSRLRNSPACKLLKGSIWTLHACQLDMDCPPTPFGFIDQKLSQLLLDEGLGTLSSGALQIEFFTDTNPAIAQDGREQHACRLTVKALAHASLDPRRFMGLIRCVEADRPLHPDAPKLTIKKLIDLISRSTWSTDYQAQLEAFWDSYQNPYRNLAKLSFIDGIWRLHKQQKISLDAYHLGLEALGLSTFPTSLDDLMTGVNGQRSVLSLVMLDDEIVPGIFQLKSRNTSHCYLHTLGDQPQCLEYISADSPWREQPLLDVMNRSDWHRHYIDITGKSGSAARLTMVECTEDLFTALTRAQRGFVSRSLESGDIPEDDADTAEHNELLLMPINPGLKLVSVVDLWGEDSNVRAGLPDPLATAKQLMQRWLERSHHLTVSVDHVYVRYVRGDSATTLGHARAPVTLVEVPSESPVSLGQALMDNYRVAHPVGFIDNGGRSVVYVDSTGQGTWTAANELPISADAVEAQIRSIDLLAVISRQLQRFWDQKGSAVEHSLRTTFMTQALLSLKMGELSRSGFDTLVNVLEESAGAPGVGHTRWSALGLHVKQPLLPGSRCVCCIGLMEFSHDQKAGSILYQAGQEAPFFEYKSGDELGAHLTRAAANEHWRATLLNYLPTRDQTRVSYLLTLWGRVRAFPKPASDLRPWLDALYHEDVHQTKAGKLCDHGRAMSPFAFMRQSMHDHSISDAEDSVITSTQVSLRSWTQRLDRLQVMLTPLSLLLTPATLASMVASAGTLYLNAKAATLPGDRSQDTKQLLLTALSLGLLSMGTLTPKLLRALRTFTTTRPVTSPMTQPTPPLVRGFNQRLQRSMAARNTRLERFFGSGSLLKTWTLPAYQNVATLVVKAWKLERKFLLWTSHGSQARTLVVSTHGYHLPWSKTAAIPNGTELRTYVPHGFELIDPKLHRVVSQGVQPYSILTSGKNTPGPASSHLPDWQLTDKALAGTSQTGRIKNYTLSKFQSERYESYRDIGNVVQHSRQSPFFGKLMSTPMDVLTVRNRFGRSNPTLEDLFAGLSRQGIHYDHILLLHCRCSAISSALGLSPAFRAPLGSTPISP
ncbi:dermonecrotic toxin domain-containing protein [Pseudomonas huanghezhanensis]|uniref:dermonecrotic toxin domain-containing protein n=1 Tax=Pseudomonas huanghezhanensis TaxID=3002903 RepID=UPI002286C06A|nr:DUF6543 domain-containing protein [Pseudomonas sp. BSw22131]